MRRPFATSIRSAADLEGYLFPETYTLARETSATELVAQMVGLFGRTFTPAMRDGGACKEPDRARSGYAGLAGGEGDRGRRGEAAWSPRCT